MLAQKGDGVTQWTWARPGARNETTGFIGRAAELEAVRSAVTQARLVTLTGPGGVGKSRVAMRAAHQAAVDFPDGVSIVELSGLRDAEFLPNTVATAVGLPEIASTEPMDQLLGHFADKQALLVLDTCEHLVDAMAVFVDILLSHSAGLVLLLTSRQPVALPGECVLPIPPMPTPEADADEHGNDSLALFVTRAKAALPTFELNTDNRSEVVALCRRLDGIPLAIELAAVRLRTMTLEQILGRLDDQFRLLSGVRTAQARHHTLRTTIEWSHELCSPPERELWARLSVFAGGFTLGAVEEVAAGGEPADWDVVDLLGALVDKSVVQRVEGVGEYRFRMLDTIREYGAERLEHSGLRQEYARRHQDFFLRMARRAGEEWLGDQQVEWGDRLAADFDNFRVAMDFAVAHPSDGAGYGLVNGLWGLWLGKSRLTEARRWIEKALVAEPEPSVEQGIALYYGAYYGLIQADRETGDMVRRCRAVAEALDDDFLRARALYVETYEMLMWSRDTERTPRFVRADAPTAQGVRRCVPAGGRLHQHCGVPRRSRQSGRCPAGGGRLPAASVAHPPRAVGTQLHDDRAGARPLGGRQHGRKPGTGPQNAALSPRPGRNDEPGRHAGIPVLVRLRRTRTRARRDPARRSRHALAPRRHHVMGSTGAERAAYAGGEHSDARPRGGTIHPGVHVRDPPPGAAADRRGLRERPRR